MPKKFSSRRHHRYGFDINHTIYGRKRSPLNVASKGYLLKDYHKAMIVIPIMQGKLHDEIKISTSLLHSGVLQSVQAVIWLCGLNLLHLLDVRISNPKIDSLSQLPHAIVQWSDYFWIKLRGWIEKIAKSRFVADALFAHSFLKEMKLICDDWYRNVAVMRSIMILYRALLSGEPSNKHKIHVINYLQRCIGHTLHSLDGCALHSHSY